MSKKFIVPITALTLVYLCVNYVTVQGQATRGADREADKQAVDKLVKDQVQAFNNRDAAAVAANWTANAEYIRNDGDPIVGRDAIQKGYADFFKTLKDKPTVEVQMDNLRFPSADTAVSEVTLRLKNERGDVIGSSWRNTLLAREDGKWKVAMVQEWDRDTSLDDSLKDLQWLIGTWHMDTKDRDVTTTYEWDENKTFIHGKYAIKRGGKVAESGTQILGKDNADGGIRSWDFQSDGGFGGGAWSRDGKKWTVDFDGVTADGKKLSATVVYVRIDADTFTWQSVQQTVDGQPIPDTAPIKVTKQRAGQ
jgi:uncharacterized protein (TIGR02246 family)